MADRADTRVLGKAFCGFTVFAKQIFAELTCFYNHIAAALFALFCSGFFVKRFNVGAFRVVGASEEFTEFAGFINHFSPAFIAYNVGFFNVFRADVRTFGVIRASEEFAVTPVLSNHGRAAFFAYNIGNLVAVGRGIGKAFFKPGVKIGNKFVPVSSAVLYSVKLIFHIGGKAYVHNVGKILG